MGNKQIVFKNLSLPDVSLSQQKTKPTKFICGKTQKEIPLQIDPKFKYKTLSLKTQNYVSQNVAYEISDKKSLKIITYNVWFDQHNLQNRLQALLKIITEADADIICLQEVTQGFSQAIWNNSKQLCAKGELFMPVIPMHWYDTVILTKFPMTFYQIPFKCSTMARNLLMGVCELVNQKNEVSTFSINCVHLESLDNQQIRIDQLKEISQINKIIDTVCLVGDLNFGDNWTEDKIIQQQYIDLWNHFQQKDTTRWTMPTTPQFKQWRPDHILIKSNKIGNENFRKNLCARIERVGTFTIAPFEDQKVEDIKNDNVVRTPSDHIGLLTNISF